ncbi:MAG: hypothetical protein U1E15_12265 [Hyphomicrobiales bacterium]
MFQSNAFQMLSSFHAFGGGENKFLGVGVLAALAAQGKARVNGATNAEIALYTVRLPDKAMAHIAQEGATIRADRLAGSRGRPLKRFADQSRWHRSGSEVVVSAKASVRRRRPG